MKTMHASHVHDWGEARRNFVFAGTVEKYFLIGWYVTYFLQKNSEKVPSNSKRKQIGMGKKSKTNEA